MPFVYGIYTLAIPVMISLATTGCGPIETAAPTATPAPTAEGTVRAGTADSASCRGAVAPWSGLKWFASASPDDLRLCLTVEGIDRREFLYKAASPVFRDDENASGIRALLDYGTDPDVGNRGSTTPLSFWSVSGWIPRPFPHSPRAPEADEAVVRAFLEAGADPNAIFAGGRGTAKPLLPLLKAARRGGPPVIPAKVSAAKSGQAWRVLHAAIGTHRAAPTIAALLEYGADPDLTVAPGQDWTAPHVAAFMTRPDIIRLLLAHGADPHAVTSHRKWTALHALAEGSTGPGAAESGHLLLDAGIDSKLGDRKGRTAWDLVRARLTPGQKEASPPETFQVLARLQTTTMG